VSFKLSPDVTKSRKVVFTNPAAPFAPTDIAPADQAWKSSKTGNTISYFSECSRDQVPLERMRDDVLLSMPEAKVVSNESRNFDDREALDSTIEGKLEGIPVRIRLLVYQKNGCRYSLSYSCRTSTFDREVSSYQEFEKGFRAP
jgi:hypothetical protein